MKEASRLQVETNQESEDNKRKKLPRLFPEEDDFVLTKNVLLIVSGQFDLASIRRLCLTHLNVSQIDQVDKCLNLEFLDLSFNNISKIERLDTLKKLKTLKLVNNNITKLENVNELKSLTCIDFKNNKISNINDLHALARLENLKDVNMKGNPVSNDKNYDVYLKRIVTNLKYIDGEHIILRLPHTVYEPIEDKPYQLSKEQSWTIINGQSLWDTDEDTIGTEEHRDKLAISTQAFTESIQNCRKIIREAQSLNETLQKLL